jgi:DNA-binding response OmpR family regulator
MAINILIVEDEPAIANIIEKRLSKAGYNTLLAHDGEEGLRMALEHHPDLLVSDILMPKMSGIDMIQTIRKDAWGKDLDIIILSNSDDIDHVSTVLEHDVFTYWVKSNVIQDIEKKVTEHLELRNKSRLAEQS